MCGKMRSMILNRGMIIQQARKRKNTTSTKMKRSLEKSRHQIYHLIRFSWLGSNCRILLVITSREPSLHDSVMRWFLDLQQILFSSEFTKQRFWKFFFAFSRLEIITAIILTIPRFS
jgi:hypothetical protein